MRSVGDPEGCLAVGAVSAVVSLLALLVETPRIGYQYFKWRKKFKRKASRLLEGAVAHAAEASGSSNYLDLLLIIPPKGGGEGDNKSIGPPILTAGQQQGYADLLQLLLLRARAAAAAELPFSPQELQTLGVSFPLPNEERDCLLNIQQRSSTTGLQIKGDSELLLPPHMSKTGLYGSLAAADEAALVALLQQQQPQQQQQQQEQQEQEQQEASLAFFSVSLMMALKARRQLWQQLAEIGSSKGDSCCCSKETPAVDVVGLDVWRQLYRKLQQAGVLLQQETAAAEEEAAAAAAAAEGEEGKEADEELQQRLQLLQRVGAVHEQQQQELLQLISSKVQEEADGIGQVAANIRIEGTGDQTPEAAAAAAAAELTSLRSRLDMLQQTAAEIGLPQQMLQQAADSLLRAAQQSHSEEDVPFVALDGEETTAAATGTAAEGAAAAAEGAAAAAAAAAVQEENDESIEMIDFPFE
ncbi:hypothetical protein, conserved [Eimeria maxima]|uniref:Uncharacterized protein n=1 Tax=Eimeria maxima TaxID=5804 RepID=U6LXP3_EIMMA|nr:hypothetical protein, conserved [Eimeria maxima]CDJ56722.1 hypothetical protein, conserved [Eimeria maxima]